MRINGSVLAVVLLCAGPAMAEGPPPKVNTPEGRTAWEGYSQTLLIRLFPDHAQALGNRPVVVVDSGEVPSAIRRPRFMVVSFSLIDLAEDEAEYASILAHEYSHELRQHVDTNLWSDLFVWAGHDEVLLEKQETEADADSLVVLRRAGFDACAAVRMLGHFIDGYRMRENPTRSAWAIVLRREQALIRDCSPK
ncbi:MAG TPA: M48 family metalloprotease [Candidatus Paceibacterota bacterium]|nr:M48 family metalloprotease [Candidatus Paceibacterota bacterium]